MYIHYNRNTASSATAFTPLLRLSAELQLVLQLSLVNRLAPLLALALALRALLLLLLLLLPPPLHYDDHHYY